MRHKRRKAKLRRAIRLNPPLSLAFVAGFLSVIHNIHRNKQNNQN